MFEVPEAYGLLRDFTEGLRQWYAMVELGDKECMHARTATHSICELLLSGIIAIGTKIS